MAYLVVQHKVQDYARWKPVYDGHQPIRKANGITCEQLLRSVDDPNSITLIFEVSDLKKIREFTRSEDLKTVMQEAGVIGLPTFSFLEEVETHELVKASI